MDFEKKFIDDTLEAREKRLQQEKAAAEGSKISSVTSTEGGDDAIPYQDEEVAEEEEWYSNCAISISIMCSSTIAKVP